MIVCPAADGTVLLITQPDHARLAATLISAWNAVPVPASSRAAVLFAIAQHDNGWQEIDAAPILNGVTARPHDFMDLPPDMKRDIWPRGIQRVAADSPLAAALVAEHALTLHAHRRADPQWHDFFSRVGELQEGLLRRCTAEAGISREDFDRSYDLLYVGDVLSLVFCNRWTGPTEARGYRITLEREDDLLRISPDPFHGARVRFEVTARAIPDRAYESDEDLRAAFLGAPVVTVQGAAAGLVTSPQR
jgi:hypothetical protein